MGGSDRFFGIIAAILVVLTAPAQAADRYSYRFEEGFQDRFTFALQKVASRTLHDIVSFRGYNGNEIVLTSYSDLPLPRAIVRWKVVPYRWTEILSQDPYMKHLRGTSTFHSVKWIPLTTYWSEALLFLLSSVIPPSNEPNPAPWLIEINHDAIHSKKAHLSDPTQSVHQLALSVTTPSGRRFLFDRNMDFDSVLGIAGLISDIVRGADTFAEKDWKFLPRTFGSRFFKLSQLSDRARGRRFLRFNDQKRDLRFVQSGELCKNALKSRELP